MTPPARDLVTVVARREILARVRDRTFIVSTVFLLVVVAGSSMLSLLLAGGGVPDITVATVGQRAAAVADGARVLGAAAEEAEKAEDEDGAGAAAAPGQAPVPAARLDVRAVADVAAVEAQVKAGEVDAALVPADGGSGVEIVASRDVPPELAALVTAVTATDGAVQRLTAGGVDPDLARRALAGAGDAVPQQRLLEPPSDDRDFALASSVAFALLFFITSFLFGMAIAQSVVEEKQSRIVEILVAAVPVRVLLAGKVLGNTALALAQITLFAAVGLAGASVAGQSGLAMVLLRSSPWFLVFFLLGFTLLSCLWAAAGAVAARQEDLQATTVPLQVLMFVPFFSAAYVYTPGTLLTTLSYVPFTAPIAMPRRLALGDAAWWEGALAALIVAATAALVVALATRIYERSLLQTGGTTGWLAALRRGPRPSTTAVPEGA